jgi:hypothetical protein
VERNLLEPFSWALGVDHATGRFFRPIGPYEFSTCFPSVMTHCINSNCRLVCMKLHFALKTKSFTKLLHILLPESPEQGANEREWDCAILVQWVSQDMYPPKHRFCPLHVSPGWRTCPTDTSSWPTYPPSTLSATVESYPQYPKWSPCSRLSPWLKCLLSGPVYRDGWLTG